MTRTHTHVRVCACVRACLSVSVCVSVCLSHTEREREREKDREREREREREFLQFQYKSSKTGGIGHTKLLTFFTQKDRPTHICFVERERESNFPPFPTKFSKRLVLHTCKNKALFGKGVNCKLINPFLHLYSV